MDWAIFAALYGVGYCITATLLARHWFQRFGVEIEGAAWGMMGALAWPLLVPAWVVKEVAGYGIR